MGHPPKPYVPSASFPSRCLDLRDVDLFHLHHRLEGALCLAATSGKRLHQRARSDLPGEAPAILAPTALTFLAAVANDRAPIAIRLFLIVRRDLKRKGLTVFERRATVETQTGNACNNELHRQDIALLAARVVARRFVNSGHFAIWKGRSVEARRIMCVLVEPEEIVFFGFKVIRSPYVDQVKRRWPDLFSTQPFRYIP